MPLKYRGTGNTQELNIFLYGDGQSSSVDIDLSQAPFGIDFKGQLPTFTYLFGRQDYGTYPDLINISVVPGKPPSVGVLHLEFASPLPEVIYGQPDNVGGPSTSMNLSIRFIYGGVVAEVEPAP